MITRFVPAVLLIPAGLIAAISASAARGGTEMLIMLVIGLLITLLGITSLLKSLAELLARRRKG